MESSRENSHSDPLSVPAETERTSNTLPEYSLLKTVWGWRRTWLHLEKDEDKGYTLYNKRIARHMAQLRETTPILAELAFAERRYARALSPTCPRHRALLSLRRAIDCVEAVRAGADMGPVRELELQALSAAYTSALRELGGDLVEEAIVLSGLLALLGAMRRVAHEGNVLLPPPALLDTETARHSPRLDYARVSLAAFGSEAQTQVLAMALDEERDKADTFATQKLEEALELGLLTPAPTAPVVEAAAQLVDNDARVVIRNIESGVLVPLRPLPALPKPARAAVAILRRSNAQLALRQLPDVAAHGPTLLARELAAYALATAGFARAAAFALDRDAPESGAAESPKLATALSGYFTAVQRPLQLCTLPLPKPSPVAPPLPPPRPIFFDVAGLFLEPPTLTAAAPAPAPKRIWPFGRGKR